MKVMGFPCPSQVSHTEKKKPLNLCSSEDDHMQTEDKQSSEILLQGFFYMETFLFGYPLCSVTPSQVKFNL